MDENSIVSTVAGLVGAIIGFSGGVLSTWLTHRWSHKADLDNLRRSKGEVAMEDLAALVMWGVENIQSVVRGDFPATPAAIFRVQTMIEIYFPEKIPLTEKVNQQVLDFWDYISNCSAKIKQRPDSVQQVSQEMAGKFNPVAADIRRLQEELVEVLRI